MKRWYIIHTFSGQEINVKNSLMDKIEQENFSEFFGKILMPTEDVMEMKLGKKQTSKRKIFPGYVLVEMQMTDESWHLVKNVSKVFGFIGGKVGNPTPISNHELSFLFKQITENSKKPKPKICFNNGETVRVIEGPFSDFNGTVEEVNYDKNRLCVGVLIFGRSTPVILNFNQVEKI